MSREKKVSDEQLRKEIEQGKTQKQIAQKHGYGYPSASLTRRANQLGFKKNYLAKKRTDGGVNIYIPPKTLEKVMEKSQESFVDKNGTEALAYSFVRVSNDGCLILKPYSKPWRRED